MSTFPTKIAQSIDWQEKESCHMRLHLPLGALAIVIMVATAMPVFAQPPQPNVEALRQERQKATAIFLDRSQPVPARLAAIGRMGYPDDKTQAALLEIGTDRTQNSAIRAAALRRHKFDEPYFDAAVKILDDPADGDENLDTNLVLDLGQRITFRSPPAAQQRFQAVLRKLLDDPRPRVRLQAYRVLVASHDSVAIGRLSESLRTRTNIPMPVGEAINLLNEDGPVNHIGVIRPYLDHQDAVVRAQAARALSVDPESRPRIISMVQDPRTPVDVRLLALRALAREDDGFPEYAVAMVGNVRENPRVREAAMRAMAGRMNYKAVDPKLQIRFATAVRAIASEPRADKALQSAAAELHAYLLKAFPAVR
jgi:hypothetical protein